MTPWFLMPLALNQIDYAPREVYHSARFEKDSRYFVIRLSKDLLDDWVITLINGRIKSKLGQSRTLAFTNFSDAFEHFCYLAKVRHHRKYQLKELFSENQILAYLLPFTTIFVQDEALSEVMAIKNNSAVNTTRKNPDPKKKMNQLEITSSK